MLGNYLLCNFIYFLLIIKLIIIIYQCI